MPGMVPELVESASATLEAALEAFASADGEALSREAPSKREWLALAERVRGDAGKVGVMCSSADGGAAALPVDVLASLLSALQQSALAFAAAAAALGGAGAGPSLRKEARRLAAGVVEPCIGLLRALEAGEDVKRAIGHVWAGCDAAAKAPLDNRAAVFKGLAGVMTVLKDTLREMEELAEEGASGSGSGSGDDGGGDDGGEPQAGSSGGGGGGRQERASDAADLDFEPGELSGGERALLAAARRLMEAGAGVVKAMGRALLTGPPLEGGSEALDGWESMLYHGRNLQRNFEDLGAAMYPPQDVADALEAAEAAATTCELMLDECPAPDALGEELGRLTAEVAAAAAAAVAAGAAAEAAAAGAAEAES